METPTAWPARGSWGAFNRRLYRLAQAWATRSRGRFVVPRPLRRPAATCDTPILYLAWGRLGDHLLGRAIPAVLRARQPGGLVMVARPEVEGAVVDVVDRFVPLDPARLTDHRGREALLAALDEPFAAVVADLHLFHGGWSWCNELIDSVSAPVKLVYEGYAPRELLAPHRRWPRSAELVRALPASGGAAPDDPRERHVWYHQRHYLAAVLRALGLPDELDDADLHPNLPAPPSTGLAARLGLAEGAYLACQPVSANRKKDLPLEVWRDVFAQFPGQQFVVLGGMRDAARARALAAPNVRLLAGATDLPQCFELIAGARLFVGIDSGLTHAAACLGRPVVCVSQASNLGWFFPYPPELGADLDVVWDRRFAACAGCGAACEHQPLWRSYRAGVRCLQELGAPPVASAIRRRLAFPDLCPAAPLPESASCTA